MEACCGSYHLGRVFASHGHDVRLMSPEYVRPYVKARKNDDRDAEGIAEATTRPTMRFVELKSQDQLDMQTLHRSRDRLVGERTALINQLRAILLERGLVAPQGKWKLKQFARIARVPAKSRHYATAARTGQIDPKHAFEMGRMNGRYASDCGRRRKEARAITGRTAANIRQGLHRGHGGQTRSSCDILAGKRQRAMVRVTALAL
jgi:transposase